MAKRPAKSAYRHAHTFQQQSIKLLDKSPDLQKWGVDATSAMLVLSSAFAAHQIAEAGDQFVRSMEPHTTVTDDMIQDDTFARFRYLGSDGRGGTTEMLPGPEQNEVRHEIMSTLRTMLSGRPDLAKQLASQQVEVELLDADAFLLKSQFGDIPIAGASRENHMQLAKGAVKKGIQYPEDGKNVVQHEWTHQIDLLTLDVDGRWGYSIQNQDGMLPGLTRTEQLTYDTERQQELERLRDGKSPLDDYVLKYEAQPDKQRAEFLAVLAETFFEKPVALQQSSPALYNQMHDFFRYDPILQEPVSKVLPEDAERVEQEKNEAQDTAKIYLFSGLVIFCMNGVTILGERRRRRNPFLSA